MLYQNISILGFRELSANIDFLQINIPTDYKDIYLAISIMHSSLNLDLGILTRYAKQAGIFCYQPKEIKHQEIPPTLQESKNVIKCI